MSGSGTVSIDVGIIDWIESVLCLDLAPSREVIEALHARAEAHYDNYRDPDADTQLVQDTVKALDGGWLHLEEIRAFQRLRGWHRTRYGNVTVKREHLAEAVSALSTLTVALGSECDDVLDDYGLSRVGPPDDPYWVTGPYWPRRISERTAVLREMTEREECGECTWCQIVRLRDKCADILSPVSGTAEAA